MNRVRLGGLCFMFSCSTAFALNPVQGWYAGLFLQVSKEPTTTVVLQNPISTPTGTLPDTINGKLTYNVLGGVGGEVGYRCNNFRGELELLYNNNSYNQLQLGDFVVKSPSSSSGLRMSGDNNMGALMVNGFYDIYTPNEDGWSQVVPYVGGGLGYSYVQYAIQFYYNDSLLNVGNIRESQSYGALQGIIGVNYFMDDFTTIGIDFRYFTTQSVTHNIIGNNTFNSRFQLYTANIVFNGAFDYG